MRARLRAGVCLCLHDSRPGREVTQEAAKGARAADITPLQRGRERERERGRERERERRGDWAGKPQTDKRVRQEQKTNERSLSSVLLATAGSLPLPLLPDPP